MVVTLGMTDLVRTQFVGLICEAHFDFAAAQLWQAPVDCHRWE